MVRGGSRFGGGPEASTVCEGVSLRKVTQNYYSKLGAGPWQEPRLAGALRPKLLSSAEYLLWVR